MTVDSPIAPTENVSRGALFALGAIPAAMLGFGLLGVLLGGIGGIIAIVVAPIAGWLYAKGAGAPLTRQGWGPFIGISAAAVILGIATGIVAATYNAFTTVGGDGGLFGSAFATTLRNQLTNNLENLAFPLIIGLGLGAAGIVSTLRGNARLGNRVAPTPAPVQAPDATTPAAPAAPLPPAPNTPSPGVMLNGKPLDTDKK